MPETSLVRGLAKLCKRLSWARVREIALGAAPGSGRVRKGLPPERGERSLQITALIRCKTGVENFLGGLLLGT